MELPKNIVQIGSPDKHYRIYVEDYVISYIKQVNRNLNGGQTGIALYGKKCVEEEVRYYFLYGATEIPGIENRGQYLSELEKEQIEAQQREFFEEWEFLAWCALNGELPDGFWVLDQGKGMMINGYATFFEKNEQMLNFMIIMGNREERRGGERMGRAEISDYTVGERRQSYDWGRLAEGGNIDHRLSERSRKLESVRNNQKVEYGRLSGSQRARDKYEQNTGWKTLLAGVAVMLCVVGIATLSDEEKMKNLQVAARQMLESINEQKLPDAQGEVLDNLSAVETEPENRPEETTGEAESLLQEGENQSQEESRMQPETTMQSESIAETEESRQEAAETEVAAEPDVLTGAQAENPPASVVQEVEAQPVPVTVTYVIQKGDMLLKICREKYGTEERMQEICELNGIEDPDDIKVGQIILLPE